MKKWLVCVAGALVCVAPTFAQAKGEFLWGVGSSEYQDFGGANSNWSEWEKVDGRIANNDKVVHSTGNYAKINQTIAKLKQVGAKSYRFSVEWSRVEPEEGVFRKDVLDQYSGMVDALLKAGIEPMITLHHFTHPSWFERKGGFEREENIRFVLRYAVKVFERLGNRVKLWCTINEPGVYAVQGYVMGAFPPGKVRSLSDCATVTKNMLRSHAAIYAALKQLPHGKKAQIGLVHQFLKFESANSWNTIANVFASNLTYMFHQAIFDALVSGEFTFDYGLLGSTDPIKLPMAKRMMDFIGVSYYSVPEIGMTQVPLRSYPEGLYDALMDCKRKLGLPIYVTMFGVSSEEDQGRAEWIKTHVAAIGRASKAGANVKGAYYCTLNDNFMWDLGYTKKFGLFEYDQKKHQYKMRKSTQVLIDAIAGKGKFSEDLKTKPDPVKMKQLPQKKKPLTKKQLQQQKKKQQMLKKKKRRR